MAKITVLDQNTINQIAAGEVIDRPSSVVKELMENAIDAGATALTVEIRDGGTSLIRITDNGSGIEKDQIETAFLRHSTSKILTASDLLTVSSLGFRGEALSSIAAVSQVELITKTMDQMTGIRYQIHGGKEISKEEIGAPDGTTFLVRNLFYNTPARKKFLKSLQTEGSYIGSLVEHMALSRPDISIRLIQNNQNKLHSSGNHNLKDLIYMIYGREIAANLIPVETKRENIQINGFIGKPVISRGNRTYENYFINGRYIRSALVNKAIEDGYHSYMMQHKYPFVVLHLTIEPEFLDVNVHPSKMELRFRNQEEVYEIVKDTVIRALSGRELIRSVSLDDPEPFRPSGSVGTGMQRPNGTKKPPETSKPFRAPEPFEKRRMEKSFSSAFPPVSPDEYAGLTEKTATDGTTEIPKTARPVQQTVHQSSGVPADQIRETPAAYHTEETESHKKEVKPVQQNLFEDKILTPEKRAEYRFIGQVFDTYWLIQYRDEFLIIDQHAAHEKVIYEKMVKNLHEKKITSQMVNPPIILTLNQREEEIFARHKDRFTALGFEISFFGGREYAVYSVPSNLFGIAQRDLLTELFDSLSQELELADETILLERLASMSCKAAVKGGNPLSTAEAQALIDELLLLENPYACPHGRPTIISMSQRELEKKFKRIV